MGPGVESGGQVDKQDYGHREQAEGAHEEAEAAALAAAGQGAEDDREDPHRDQ